MVTILALILSHLMAGIIGGYIAYRSLLGLVGGGFTKEILDLKAALKAAEDKIAQLRKELKNADLRASAKTSELTVTTLRAVAAVFHYGSPLIPNGKKPVWDVMGEGQFGLGYMRRGKAEPVFVVDGKDIIYYQEVGDDVVEEVIAGQTLDDSVDKLHRMMKKPTPAKPTQQVNVPEWVHDVEHLY